MLTLFKWLKSFRGGQDKYLDEEYELFKLDVQAAPRGVFVETSRFKLCEALRRATQDLENAVYDDECYDPKESEAIISAYAARLGVVAMAISAEFGDLIDD